MNAIYILPAWKVNLIKKFYKNRLVWLDMYLDTNTDIDSNNQGM